MGDQDSGWKDSPGSTAKERGYCVEQLGHSAKMSFYSEILYAKFFDCGVSLGNK
jgi:hypothetical protein